jgi:hypothetical protein
LATATLTDGDLKIVSRESALSLILAPSPPLAPLRFWSLPPPPTRPTRRPNRPRRHPEPGHRRPDAGRASGAGVRSRRPGVQDHPDRKAIEGKATLTLTAKAPLDKLVLDFDRIFAISALTVDGKACPLGLEQSRGPPDDHPAPQARQGPGPWWQITYDGVPHEAKKAPWDGGFVWARPRPASRGSPPPCRAKAATSSGPASTSRPASPSWSICTSPCPRRWSAPANGVFLGMTEKDGWRTYNWRAKTPNTYAIAVDVGPYEEMKPPTRAGSATASRCRSGT